MILVRARAWWFNKVPLSVMLALLLIDGQPLSVERLCALALLVFCVCSVGNYGYALNDLFDIAEDLKVGRANTATIMGGRRMWTIVVLSAIAALSASSCAAGIAGLLLTAGALLLPLAYSVPPLRIKERKWLGIAADALAAHVFPAVLALFIAAHFDLRPISAALILATALWSSATGLRGIITHQLQTADRDREAGLDTVVHQLGYARMLRIVIKGILPVEMLSFMVLLLSCDTGPLLWVGVGIYLLNEIAKTFSGRFVTNVFRLGGQPYLPFVEESFYKVWGPLLAAVDASRRDLFYLVLIPVYAMVFRPHILNEYGKLRAVRAEISALARRRFASPRPRG